MIRDEGKITNTYNRRFVMNKSNFKKYYHFDDDGNITICDNYRKEFRKIKNYVLSIFIDSVGDILTGYPVFKWIDDKDDSREFLYKKSMLKAIPFINHMENNEDIFTNKLDKFFSIVLFDILKEMTIKYVNQLSVQ
jgi:hypothetical protein